MAFNVNHHYKVHLFGLPLNNRPVMIWTWNHWAAAPWLY